MYQIRENTELLLQNAIDIWWGTARKITLPYTATKERQNPGPPVVSQWNCSYSFRIVCLPVPALNSWMFPGASHRFRQYPGKDLTPSVCSVIQFRNSLTFLIDVMLESRVFFPLEQQLLQGCYQMLSPTLLGLSSCYAFSKNHPSTLIVGKKISAYMSSISFSLSS